MWGQPVKLLPLGGGKNAKKGNIKLTFWENSYFPPPIKAASTNSIKSFLKQNSQLGSFTKDLIIIHAFNNESTILLQT